MLGKRILVVDDEALVLESVRMTLGYFGYAVETAGSASEALDKLAEGAFSLVVTDRKMPGTTGEQLALEVKRRWPKLPVLMLTGFPPEMKPDAVDVVLLKPFSITELRSAVDGLLE